MMLFILGVLDIIVAVALWMSSGTPLTGNGLVMLLGIAWIIKGLISVISSAASKFFFDFLGILDFIGGMFLVLSASGFSFHFFFYAAILMLLKGIYTAGTDFLTTFLRGA